MNELICLHPVAAKDSCQGPLEHYRHTDSTPQEAHTFTVTCKHAFFPYSRFAVER